MTCVALCESSESIQSGKNLFTFFHSAHFHSHRKNRDDMQTVYKGRTAGLKMSCLHHSSATKGLMCTVKKFSKNEFQEEMKSDTWSDSFPVKWQNIRIYNKVSCIIAGRFFTCKLHGFLVNLQIFKKYSKNL